MQLNATKSCAVALALACLVLALSQASWQAAAAERVRFESARFQLGPLQARLARERGEDPRRRPVDILDGYLFKPAGDGPFPALVLMHPCAGLPASFKSGETGGSWAERLLSWAYVVLVVDSFTTRGLAEACGGQGAPQRIADAHGALLFLARQPFVDPNRIAAIGFSQGGHFAMSAVEQREVELFEEQDDRKFKAVVAFYPLCLAGGGMTAPTLILIGDLDEWTPAAACRNMLARRSGKGSPVTLIAYPGAHHSFDVPVLQPGRQLFGYRVEYNAAAAEKAVHDVWRFLAEHLRN